MANRYNDQDYPQYYDRFDRYDSQSERPGDERQRNRSRFENRPGGSDDYRSGENFSGVNHDRSRSAAERHAGGNHRRGHESDERDYNEAADRARRRFNESDRHERAEGDDYTLYGYNRESVRGAREIERRDDDRDDRSRRDFTPQRPRSMRGSGYDREENFRRGDDRESEYGRSGNFGGSGKSFYGQGGGYVEPERGYDYDRDRGENRGGEERGWWERTTDAVSSWFGDEDAARRVERDERQSGGQTHYRGRGPKNYRRSDERIRDDINDRLTDHAYLDASDIEVEVTGGEVTLTGLVDSRYAKRMAEDIAENVSGVTHVENRLRARGQTGTSHGSGQDPASRNTSIPAASDTSLMDGGAESGGVTGATIGSAPTAGSTGGSAADADSTVSGETELGSANRAFGSQTDNANDSSIFDERGVDRLSNDSK